VVFDTAELSSILETFLDAFQSDNQTQLNVEKLLLLETYLNTSLLSRGTSEPHLLHLTSSNLANALASL